MILLSLVFAARDLCDRPTLAFSNTAGFQPGRLAHGPEENSGIPGKAVGCIIVSFKFTPFGGKRLPVSVSISITPEVKYFLQY
jgi:hypothetical protein